MQLAPGALDVLRRHAWPGNVRELANVIERAALLADSAEITAAALRLDPPPSPPAPSSDVSGASIVRGSTMPWRAEGAEPILAALTVTGGNVVQAAARLGIPRNTLRYRMRRLGLSPAPGVPAVSPSESGGASMPLSRWEHPHVALLRLRLVGDDVWPASTSAHRLERIADTVRAFGGRLESQGSLTLLASFGTTPTEDVTARAAHAALAAVTAARDDDPPVGVRAALHVATVPLAVDPDGTRIDGRFTAIRDGRRCAGRGGRTEHGGRGPVRRGAGSRSWPISELAEVRHSASVIVAYRVGPPQSSHDLRRPATGARCAGR
jgi:hypothetical protein